MDLVNSVPPSVPINGVSTGAFDGLEMRGCQVLRGDRNDTDAFAGWQGSLHHGTCIKDDVATGTSTAAVRRSWKSVRKPQLVRSRPRQSAQVPRGIDEGIVEAGPLLFDHAVRGGAWDDLVEDWKRECRGVADITVHAWELGLQHEDAKRRPVDRFAASWRGFVDRHHG